MTRDDALGTLLRDLGGWHLTIGCSTCRELRELPIDSLADRTRTVAELLAALRCRRHGTPPDYATLANGRPFTGRGHVISVSLLPEQDE